MEHIDEQSIKKIIESGKYDLDLISFELDIPIEQLEKYKKELEKENKPTEKSVREKYKVNTKSLKAPRQEKNLKDNATTKVEKMRKKYAELTQIEEKENDEKEIELRSRHR